MKGTFEAEHPVLLLMGALPTSGADKSQYGLHRRSQLITRCWRRDQPNASQPTKHDDLAIWVGRGSVVMGVIVVVHSAVQCGLSAEEVDHAYSRFAGQSHEIAIHP